MIEARIAAIVIALLAAIVELLEAAATEPRRDRLNSPNGYFLLDLD